MPTLKNLLGGWKLIESENYDALFQKMGTFFKNLLRNLNK